MKVCSLLLIVLSPAAVLAADSPADPGTAFITGSDRGIGFALVQEFESRGWQVIATARDPAKAAELNAFAKTHPRVNVEKLDVTDTAGIDALALKLKDHPIDALVNNAGIAGTGAKRGVITVLLSPGAVDTDMQRTIRSDMAQAGKPITSPTGTPAEVAHVTANRVRAVA